METTIRLREYDFGICTVQMNEQRPKTCGVKDLQNIRKIYTHGQIIEDIKISGLCPEV
jgi:hypothetical protein